MGAFHHRGRYSAELKAKFVGVVEAAKKQRLAWPEIHKRAKEAGYEGSAQSLTVMMSKLARAKKMAQLKAAGGVVHVSAALAHRNSHYDAFEKLIEAEVSRRLEERTRNIESRVREAVLSELKA